MPSSNLPTIAFFSDVDGTMMDEKHNFALDRTEIRAIAPTVELILTSSRTLVELARIQRRLGLVAALVAENGAVVGLPPGWRQSRARSFQRLGGRDLHEIPLGRPAAELRRRMRRCARIARVEPIEQDHTLPDRGRSLRRTHSLCVMNWRGPSADHFVSVLREDGLEATRSGTWITITAGAHKGDGVAQVLARAERNGAPYQWSAAIGNAENDAALLAATDVRFAIRNPRTGHDRALTRVRGARKLSAVGLAGWRDALEWILLRHPRRP